MEHKGRILCVTSNFPRWSGDSTTPFVLNLAVDLQKLGWRVDVLAPHAPGSAMREVISGVHVERFRYLWPESAETVCYQGGALVNLRKNKINLLKLPALVASEWVAVVRKLASRDYSVLHSHWVLPQGFVCTLASKIFRVPHAITVHGGDVFALQGTALNAFKRFALSSADAVTVNSSATEKAVMGICRNTKRLVRIPMGVSTETIDRDEASVKQIRNRYRKGDGPLLVFVGRLVEEKGVGDLIEAVYLLKDRMQDATAVFVGEGQDRRHFENMVAERGLSEHITFTGWVQPKDIKLYLTAADIFVGPSRISEAQGLTFLESMVARLPVIATRVGGIVDTVIDGVTGLTVSERSPNQIASAIYMLIKDPDLRERIVDNAYQLAICRFSRSVSANAFSILFSGLIE